MNVFFLSSWFPFPPDNGSKIRIYHLLRALGQRHEVTLLSFVEAGASVCSEHAPSFCRVADAVPRIEFQPRRARALTGLFSGDPRSVVDTYSAQMMQEVKHHLAQTQYDVIIASEIVTAPYARADMRIPKILDELQVSVIRDQYSGAKRIDARLRHGLTWLKMRGYVQRTLRRFDGYTVVSEKERSNLQSIAPTDSAVAIIPNGVDTEALSPSMHKRQSQRLIFNGALTYGANYDAMQFFLSSMWPQIRAQQPDVHLQITGKTDGVNLNALTFTDHVEFTGYLSSVHAAVAQSTVCVVPLRIGGGTRLKILEAMALGTPVVATSKGAEGLNVRHEENILIADEPVEFAAQVVRLLRDADLCERLAHNARALVEQQYDWNQIGKQFTTFIEAMVKAHRTN